MDKKHVMAGIFVLVVLLAAGGYAAVVAPNATAAPPATAPGLETPPASGGGVCSAEALSVADEPWVSASMEDTACSRCPDGSPQCWVDKQCDSICGGKGLGDCVRINSCYKCCYCAL